MTTLQKTMLNVAELLKETFTSAATGGSTSTLVDTACPDPNDWYNNGVIFFVSGNNAGKSAIITDYNSTTHTFTFATQTGACAAGDRYTALKGWTREELVRAVGQGLEEIGACLQIDDSLAGVADQLAYTLPDGVVNVRRVEAGDDREINYYWVEAAGELIFTSGKEPDAGATLYLWYVGEHAAVSADADTVSDYINAGRLAWSAAYYAALARSRRVENANPALAEFVKLAQSRMLELAARKPNITLAKDPRHAGGY